MSKIDDLTALSERLKKRFGGKIKDIVVFGSYARGDHCEGSDIDILIVVDDEKIEKDLRKVAYSFIPEIGRLISVKVIGVEIFKEMKKGNFSFIRSIESEGISIG